MLIGVQSARIIALAFTEFRQFQPKVLFLGTLLEALKDERFDLGEFPLGEETSDLDPERLGENDRREPKSDTKPQKHKEKKAL